MRHWLPWPGGQTPTRITKRRRVGGTAVLLDFWHCPRNAISICFLLYAVPLSCPTYSLSKSSYWWCSCLCKKHRLESGGLNQSGDVDILRSESDNFSKGVCSDRGCRPVFAMVSLSDHQTMDSRTNGFYQDSHPACWRAEAMVPWLAPMICDQLFIYSICLFIGTLLDTHSMTRFFMLGMTILKCLPLYRLACM